MFEKKTYNFASQLFTPILCGVQQDLLVSAKLSNTQTNDAARIIVNQRWSNWVNAVSECGLGGVHMRRPYETNRKAKIVQQVSSERTSSFFECTLASALTLFFTMSGSVPTGKVRISIRGDEDKNRLKKITKKLCQTLCDGEIRINADPFTDIVQHKNFGLNPVHYETMTCIRS